MDKVEIQEIATEVLSWINWHKHKNHVEGMSQEEILDSIELKVHDVFKEELEK